jgi:Transcription factor zinc-finger
MWQQGKPSQNENEYFARRDAEWLKEQRGRLDVGRSERDAKSTGMLCPRCQGDLQERTFHHVRIDVCASCRGVWLDAGEMHMLAHVEPMAMLEVIREIDTASS